MPSDSTLSVYAQALVAGQRNGRALRGTAVTVRTSRAYTVLPNADYTPTYPQVWTSPQLSPASPAPVTR